MPVDSRDKRASVIALGLPVGRVAPGPDGNLANRADRQHLAGLYAGITGRPIKSVTLTVQVGETLAKAGAAGFWDNPGNITSPGGDAASATTASFIGVSSHYLVGRNIGSLPEPALEIVGLQVEAEAQISPATPVATNLHVQLWYDGAVIGEAQAPVALTTSYGYISWGGPDADWGVELTEDLVTSPAFGAALWTTTGGSTTNIRHVRITVYYVPDLLDQERSVVATAALAALDITRGVTATAALMATVERSVPALAALMATEARSVEADAALSATVERSVPATAALRESGWSLNVQATAALSATEARNVAALAALWQADITRGVTATAALMATFQHSVPALAALMATIERSVPATAALWEDAPTLSVVATAALSQPVYVIAGPGRTAPPQFTLTVTGPLPGRRAVSHLEIPPEVALSFGSELPGGWARLDVGMVRPELRAILTATERQAMMLPEDVGAPAFGHVEIRTEGGALVWEGRVATRSDVGGEIRGLTALGYGLSALKDMPIPHRAGQAGTAVVVRTIVAEAAPLIQAGVIQDPGVLRDFEEFGGMLPYQALEALAETGCGTCPGWAWTVYRRVLDFFPLGGAGMTPDYVVPADGTVSRELDDEAVYTGVQLRYTDLQGVERSTGVLRDRVAEARLGFARVLPLSGGRMTPSAALAFAATELRKRSTPGVSMRIERDWRRGVELAGSSGTRPVWEVRAGEVLQVANDEPRIITSVSYDAASGRGEIRLGHPVSTDELAVWGDLVSTASAVRSGRDPVTRGAGSS